MTLLDDVIKHTQQYSNWFEKEKFIHRNITDNTIYCTVSLFGYACYMTYINETIGFAFFAVPSQDLNISTQVQNGVVLIYSRIPFSDNLYPITLPQGDKRLYLGHQDDEVQEKLAIIWNLWSKLCSRS